MLKRSIAHRIVLREIVLCTAAGSASVSHKGDGTFRKGQILTTVVNPFALAVTDFNNDGTFLADSNLAGDSVAILLGKGDGTFETTATYFTPDLAHAFGLSKLIRPGGGCHEARR